MKLMPRVLRLPWSIPAAALLMAAALPTQAALKEGIVAYWPLDQIVGTKTPDLVSGYDLELVNLTSADLVDGKRGKAFKFENARQTMLKRVHTAGEQLPINQFPAFTVTFWANVKGTGQTDLRLFSEGSTSNNNPLFNLGTDSTGATDSLDLFFRNGTIETVNHIKSVGTPLDGTWRHVTYVQQSDGSRAIYVDGVKDDLEVPAMPAGAAWVLNTTTVGGILRANPTHWVTGQIDEVALWSRALTPAEITELVGSGLTSVFPPLANGMVAFWPMDEILGVKTPDLVNGYDMELVNLTAADQTTGKRGKAFKFENARQTMLKRVHSAGEQLPINQNRALTISMWAKVAGTGQTDLRLFSEGSTSNNNPLFNLGTDSTGATDSLDVFIRNGTFETVNHLKTTGTPLDGTWRHIVFVQATDGARAIYLDGVKDALEVPAMPVDATWVVNTTTIGGILRANPTHWVTGELDEVALWNRALSEAEIKSLFSDGTPVPFSKPQPLVIRSFAPDFASVAAGDSVTLRWDVTKNVLVTLDNGVGDVTAKTVSGLGSVTVPVTQSRTYKLTLSRGTESVSSTVKVHAIGDVASGWTLLENFDRYAPGNLNGNGYWKDLTATGFSIVDVGGNPMLAPNGGDVGAVLPLRDLTVVEGQRRTLFLRAYLQGDPADNLRGEIVLTDRRLRFGNETSNGPGARISDELDDVERLVAVNGYQGQLENFDHSLELLTAYNVWIDINNGPFAADKSSTGDTYSIHVQKASGGARTTLFTDYAADRDPVGVADTGFTLPNLDSLAILGRASHATTRNLLFDDIYLSQSGYNATVPRAFGVTTPIPEAAPSVAIARNGAQVQITFAGGNLQSADSVSGPWTDVSGASSPLVVATGTGNGKFYRVRQ